MLQRNWLQLDRKLVDKTDMEFTVDGMEDEINEVSLAMWGPGVLITTVYPTPFGLTLSGSNMNIIVGNGIGFDTLGAFTSINPSTTNSNTIADTIGNATNPRWDLLAIEYAQVGDTLVPEPSNPLVNVPLNLHDDFTLVIVHGTPSPTPAYPTYSGPGFVLAGLQVPAGATMASQIGVDYSQRQMSRFGIGQQPVFVNEIPTGSVNGTNATFTLSQSPISSGSLVVTLDGEKVVTSSLSLSGTSITLSPAPSVGQAIRAAYVAASPNSQNPLQGFIEVPTGTIDGVNLKFSLVNQPLYQAAVDLWMDGLMVPQDRWSLVMNAGSSSYILFVSGFQPTSGQVLEARVWHNTWPNYSAPAGGGGGGGSTVEVHGSFSSPIPLDPSVGLVPTAAMEQTWYLEPLVSGVYPITADPRIAPGSTIGQRVLIKGVSPTDYLIFPGASGHGVNQNGDCDLIDNQALQYEWDGGTWNENYRRN